MFSINRCATSRMIFRYMWEVQVSVVRKGGMIRIHGRI